jgi:hypothetical protein
MGQDGGGERFESRPGHQLPTWPKACDDVPPPVGGHDFQAIGEARALEQVTDR